MSQHNRFVPVAVLMFFAGFSRAPAQDLGFGFGVTEFGSPDAPPALVTTLLETSDFVGIGRFAAPPDQKADRQTLLEFKELDVPFTVDTVYKGNLPPNTVVRIRVPSDMFVYPGESVSRNAKRIDLRNQIDRDFEAVATERAALDAGLADRAISRAEFESQQRAQDVEVEQLASRSSEIGGRIGRLYSSHGPTFYDLGGALQPDELYLIAVSSVNGDSSQYVLSESTAPLSVFWGERADDLRLELEKRTGILSLTPPFTKPKRSPE